MREINNEYLVNKLEDKDSNSTHLDYYNHEDLLHYIYKDTDHIEFQKGESKVNFTYSTPTIKEVFGLAKDYKKDLNRAVSLLLKNYKQIKYLEIKNDKKEINIHTILGNDYKVFFNPYSSGKISSMIDTKDKIIFVQGDPLNTKGLLSLFHEVGHKEVMDENNNNPEFLKEYGKEYENILKDKNDILTHPEEDWFRSTTETAAAFILKNERDAWAKALQNLKSFRKDFSININETEDLIHNQCLKSHSDFIREQL